MQVNFVVADNPAMLSSPLCQTGICGSSLTGEL